MHTAVPAGMQLCLCHIGCLIATTAVDNKRRFFIGASPCRFCGEWCCAFLHELFALALDFVRCPNQHAAVHTLIMIATGSGGPTLSTKWCLAISTTPPVMAIDRPRLPGQHVRMFITQCAPITSEKAAQHGSARKDRHRPLRDQICGKHVCAGGDFAKNQDAPYPVSPPQMRAGSTARARGPSNSAERL